MEFMGCMGGADKPLLAEVKNPSGMIGIYYI